MRSEGASSDWRDSATIIDSTFPTALFVLKSTEIRDRLAGSIRSMGVSPEFAFTLLTASFSGIAAIVSVVFSRRATRFERLERADQLAVRFREPLLQAAYNLQSRLFNIARQHFLGRFLTATTASDYERDYAVHNTTFLIAQYFGWVEIIRTESQYLDPKNLRRNREVARAMERIRDVFADSTTYQDRTLRLFRGEQRALGEGMMIITDDTRPGVPRRECLGYGLYLARRDDPARSPWLSRLEQDVAHLAADPAGPANARLAEIQHALLQLVVILDPRGDRVPLTERTRI